MIHIRNPLSPRFTPSEANIQITDYHRSHQDHITTDPNRIDIQEYQQRVCTCSDSSPPWRLYNFFQF